MEALKILAGVVLYVGFVVTLCRVLALNDLRSDK